jgi:hemerythrin
MRPIDEDHRELRETIGSMLARLAGPEAEAEAKRVLDYLADHVTRHFRDEERVMRDSGYPDLEKHLAEHRKIAEYIANLRAELDGGYDPDLLVVGNRLVCNWLITHLTTSDTHFDAFARRAG